MNQIEETLYTLTDDADSLASELYMLSGICCADHRTGQDQMADCDADPRSMKRQVQPVMSKTEQRGCSQTAYQEYAA